MKIILAFSILSVSFLLELINELDEDGVRWAITADQDNITRLGREVPNVPCTVYFEEAEWKALVAFKTKNPKAPESPPSLREAVRMLGSLGGHLGRKGDGEPGTKTLWLGIQRLDDLTAMWKIFSAKLPHRSVQ